MLSSGHSKSVIYHVAEQPLIIITTLFYTSCTAARCFKQTSAVSTLCIKSKINDGENKSSLNLLNVLFDSFGIWQEEICEEKWGTHAGHNMFLSW